MTTRSGHEYSIFVQTMSGDELSDMHNEDRQAEPSLTKMLQALLADCEEQRCWEKVHHEQELAQHKEEQKIQLDLMKALMEETPPSASLQAITPELVLRKLSEADDIEAYYNTFERQVTSP